MSLAKLRINIFYVVSAVLTLILAAYSWTVFLPQFASSEAYSTLRLIISGLVIMLVGAACIQVYLSIEREHESQ